METKERLRKDDSSGISKVEPRDNSSLQFIPDFFCIEKVGSIFCFTNLLPKVSLVKN